MWVIVPAPWKLRKGFKLSRDLTYFVLKDFSSCYLKLGYRYEQKQQLEWGLASSVVKDGGGSGSGTK